MGIHQEHFGRKFYQDKDKGYWISLDYSRDRPRVRAHVWVWKNINGNIPKDHHIHHKDGNRSNNGIENLQMIARSLHLSMHMQDPIRRQYARDLANDNRHLTKAWHASPEGRAWHRYHALKCKFGKGKEIEYKCQFCEIKFKSTKKSRAYFCSNNCKSKWRRAQGFDNIERECLICKKLYLINKYSKSKTCGRICGSISCAISKSKQKTIITS